MLRELSPRNLSWDEVDPARHPFDSVAAAREVRSLGPARHVPVRPDVPVTDPAMSAWSWDVGKLWADAMSYALAERYGRWVLGWRWAHDEGDFDGGPVGNWCCPRHSMVTPEGTLERVVAALCEWRAWLESLAERFEAYPLELAGIEDQRILWERAARNLILQVVDRTGCGSGWYAHCRQVLTWFLSRWGVAPAVADDLVGQAIGGRFLSWIGPDTVVVDDVAEQLSRTLRPEHGAGSAEPPVRDHLERWLAVRETVAWQDAPDGGGGAPVTPSRDGAAEDIRAFDGAVDPARAQGLLTALERLRADAAQGAPLDVELLSGWQQHVLGTARPPAFRTLPAFAKGGRERYGISPDTRARLDACLAESAEGDGSLPLTARAARAYLDVCFFHPFADGNARSAFLALVFVLAREGVTLDSVGLLRRIAFRADDPKDGLTLARYVDLHLRGTRDASSAGS
ncbi:Fic family protein [Streptomyces camelliae]|uniref:Fic family protein n=1 Tax=Streptomyces camelliae TaxID=3004093 RepID=A0ABY7PD11_9ACTN|nr:Fic family protein [Streptomyces sp. HUAS 2-6]WBO68476.1 Fic family protein [Streptomyces sp. HUAS 2-6]